MPTLSLQVNDNANDAKYWPGLGSWDPASADTILGNYGSSSPAGLWTRFTNVTIAQGTTITSAVLTIYQKGGFGSGTTAVVKSRFEAADNATMPTSLSDANGRTRTTAQGAASWTISGSNTTETITVTSPVQEVFDRPGWASGNSLGNELFDNGSATNNYMAVFCRDGDSAKAAKLDITYASAPTVSSVSANSGPAAGGTNVTITGTNFVATPTVTFGGQAATNVAFVNSTTITCTTPAHAAGAVDVVVTNPDTQAGTGTGAFTYLAGACTDQSVMPAPACVSASSVCYSGFGSGSGFGI